MPSTIHSVEPVPPFELQDPSLLKTQCHVNGNWVPAKSKKNFHVIDPGTGKPWALCPDCGAEDVEPAVQAAHAAFKSYSRTTPRRRAQLVLEWHRLIQASREDIARILVHETGKPLAEALGEVDYALTFVWWFAGEAERAHQGTTVVSAIPGRRAMVIKQPIGVVAALVPWNFPVALMLRKAAAALAAGCTMVIKPSPETPLTSLALVELAVRAGIPTGALGVLTTSLENTPAVAEALSLHDLVKVVSFTGSTRVGKLISQLCAKNLKRTVLELGGNCPFIVFDDANMDQAIEQLMALKWRHAGQACVSANRLYVQSGIYDTFVEKVVEKTRQLKVGHGMQDGVTMGALTTPQALDRAEEMFADAVAKGAKVVLGNGKREASEGYFYAPTIVVNAQDSMRIGQEEIFTPLLGISRFETEEEVVERANNTPLGLTSYVFTKNVDRLWRMFENLQAGMIGLNTGNNSAAESPFGGIKESGHGKESGKDIALDEFFVTKTGTLTVEGHF